LVEIARAMKRTRLYGFAEGLLIYDPTQWSRNFTFGMLYAFTLNFDLAGTQRQAHFFCSSTERFSAILPG